MSKYRNRLPQLEGGLFLTDGGIETSLIFLDGLELPYFAAFHLLRTQEGRQAIKSYYERYLAIAVADKAGFVLESPTWRASPDWAAKLGYQPAELDAANRSATAMMAELRKAYETADTPVVISGCVGPRGDGYVPGDIMSGPEAAEYHGRQIKVLAAAGADMVTAITMTNTSEAIGIVRAARALEVPVVISFTLETDGRLPTGQPLGEAIGEVDAVTGNGPAYYMINCAHPSHFDDVLERRAQWMGRVRGLRANASRRSHQELNEAPDLDAGNPRELGSEYRGLVLRFPHINVLGGCCGTDHRHIQEISHACRHVRSAAA